MDILVIDGQGGKLGVALVSMIKSRYENVEIMAVGTNTIATSAMLKAGATYGATGENPVIVACKKAKVILGPIGIICANSLFGEITPKMATAVCKSEAQKILIPVNKCNLSIIGIKDAPYSEYINSCVEELKHYID